jgi:DNA-binding beta-propeller fold protein YncE
MFLDLSNLFRNYFYICIYFKQIIMKKIVMLLLLLSQIFQIYGQNNNQSNKILLPTGWSLSPAGRSLPLGDFPMNMTVSKSGKLLAVVNNGQGKHSLQLINTKTEKLLHNLELPCAWLGLAFSKDEKSLFVSGGNKNQVYRYSIDNQRLKLRDTFEIGKPFEEKISLAGLCVDDASNLLYVVSKESNSLYALDLKTKKIVFQQKLPSEAYTCALTPDGKKLLISLWGAKKIAIWNTKTRKIDQQIQVGDNPNDLTISHNGKYAYVANADDNSVSVMDLSNGKVLETLVASLFPDAPTGSTTNSVALSKNGKTLYVANADNNCLAVFDVSQPGQSASKGFIPVGWYPTTVRVMGKKIFVANGKGFSSFPNPNGPQPTSVTERTAYQKGDTSTTNKIQYIGSLMKGSLSIINVPKEAQMRLFSKQVYENSPYTKEREKLAEGQKNNPIPQKVGNPSPIKYVFYIIKENRTYDQVLGDLPEGNGDASLCLFPEKITPNQHKLAREFVLLDNFYVAAEVSADGHNWSTAAYANDFTEKTWVQSYGDRGGDYVYEGQAEIAHPKGGFIWDHCLRAGISYRTYGEFADDYKPNIAAIKDHYCPYFTSWDTEVRDTTRVRQWRRDFDSLLLVNAVPKINTLRLINDHTSGLHKGSLSPYAQVADNDYAVGLFIEYLSNSPIWKESVVFILEDDAQNGADHIDAHRSIAFVASPYTRRHFRDTTQYTTNSMLRTLELIVGLPPMSQHDAAATPMWRCFTDKPDFTPFKAIIPDVNLDERNVSVSPLAKQFDYFDFAGEDRVPDLLFNQLLWKALKGEDSEMPAPRRGAWALKMEEEAEED